MINTNLKKNHWLLVILTAIILSCAVAVTSIGDVNAAAIVDYNTSEDWKGPYQVLSDKVDNATDNVKKANETVKSTNKSLQDSEKNIETGLKNSATFDKNKKAAYDKKIATKDTYKTSLDKYKNLLTKYANYLSKYKKFSKKAKKANKAILLNKKAAVKDAKKIANTNKNKYLAASNRYETAKLDVISGNSQLTASISLFNYYEGKLGKEELGLENAIRGLDTAKESFYNFNETYNSVPGLFNKSMDKLYNYLVDTMGYERNTSAINETKLAEDYASLAGLTTGNPGYDEFIAEFKTVFRSIVGDNYIYNTTFINDAIINSNGLYYKNFLNIIMNNLFGDSIDNSDDYVDEFFAEANNSLVVLNKTIEDAKIAANQSAAAAALNAINDAIEDIINHVTNLISTTNTKIPDIEVLIGSLNDYLAELEEANITVSGISNPSANLLSLLDELRQNITAITNVIEDLEAAIAAYQVVRDGINVSNINTLIDAQNNLTALEDTVISLTGNLTAAQDANSAANPDINGTIIDTITNDINDLISTTNATILNNQQLLADLNDYLAELEEANVTVSAIVNPSADLLSLLDELRQNITAITNVIADLEAAILAYETARDAMDLSAINTIIDAQNNLTALNDVVDLLEGNLTAAENANSTANPDINGTIIDTIKDDINGLVTTMDIRLTTVKQCVNDLKANLTALESAKDALVGNFSAAGYSSSDLTDALNSLTANITAINDAIIALEANITAYDDAKSLLLGITTINDAQNNLAAINTTITDINTAIIDANNTISNAQTEIDQLNQTIGFEVSIANDMDVDIAYAEFETAVDDLLSIDFGGLIV